MEERCKVEESLTPEKVANNDNLKYSIPLYQRLFEWEYLQLHGLLRDLANHAKSGHHKPYYIGMLTGNDRNIIDLVDGQQRFTTLMLLALVLRKYYSPWSKFLLSGGSRLQFFARDNDTSYLQ